VLRIYGIKTGQGEQSSDVLAKKLKARIMTEAWHIAQTGGMNQTDMPVLKEAIKLLVAAENDDSPKNDSTDSQMGLTAVGLSPGESILETVKGLNDDFHFNRMAKRQRDLGEESAKN
jgi:hypothetical protein